MKENYVSKSTMARAAAIALAYALTGPIGMTSAADLSAVEQSKPQTSGAMILDIQAILNRWEPIAVAAGAGSSYWREMYATQLAQLSDYWVRQVALVNVDGSNPRASYARFTQAFVNARFNMVREAQSGKGSLKLGSTTSDQVFIPITPCRVVDTRNVGGAIGGGTSRAFYFYTASNAFSWSTQGGAGFPAGTPAVSTCPGTVTIGSGGLLGNVPPSAAMATVTVVNASAPGNFLIWSGVGASPTSSALNWAAGQVLANTTVIPAGPQSGGALHFTVQVNSSGFADVIVDIVGYFTENAATALQCATTTVTGNPSDSVGDLADYTVALPGCPAGYAQTGTGCSFGNISGVYLIEHATEGSFNDCKWRNVSGGPVSGSNFRADSRCCRVPGQ
jgi:hypothetical protein